MGFTRHLRNNGPFVPSAIQEVYDLVGRSLPFDADENFVYPSKLVDGIMLGWENEKKIQIWPNKSCKVMEKEADKIVKMLKDKEMVNSTPIEKIMLDYKIISKETHVAEISILFEDSYSLMN